MEVTLNQSKYYGAEKKNQSVKVDLKNDMHNLLNDDYNLSIDEYNIYLNERYDCNKIRLTAQVNLIASNILFNSVTEITKNDDSDNCTCLNFKEQEISSTIGKENKTWGGANILDCVRDTQLSYDGDSDKNYTYHCGIDIMNNHILRAKDSFPISRPLSQYLSSSFNTIQDTIRDIYGNKEVTSGTIQSQMSSSQYFLKHVYTKNNILSAQDTLTNRVEDKNGWLGFINRSKITTYDSNGNDLGISRVINNKPSNNFIEFYPDSSCYSINPYYNKVRHRKEKNWEYCLCYPYSSTTEGISCINQTLDTLKIAYIDESQIDSDGLQKTCVYSVSKHGLQAGDIINIYRSSDDESINEIAYESVIIDGIVDDYCFYVILDEDISNNWISVFDEDLITANGIKINDDGEYSYGKMKISPVNNLINADFFTDEENLGSQNLSFAKVVNDRQCKYYVRIFSRFPNFDNMVGEVDENTIYDKYNDSTTNIEEYSKIDYEKQSNQIKLGFAKNAYGDDISQIVYVDDIDINNIKDNLGRPLTSLYLMFFKTNYGYKSWYGCSTGNDEIEHSHCFGKLNCGFKYSDYIDDSVYTEGNINYMNNCKNGPKGISLKQLTGEDDDEIIYKNQTYFYGDLVEYSDYNCKETVLQKVCHRFNTMQRELSGYQKLSSYNKFKSVSFDEIVRDDYDMNGFYINNIDYDEEPLNHPEGYYYECNYEIPIRTFQRYVNESVPRYFKILSILQSGPIQYTITTSEENNINKDDNVHLYDSVKNAIYKCEVVNSLSTTKIVVNVYNEDGEQIALSKDKNGVLTDNYKFYVRYESIPSYATYIGDNGGVYRWRNVIQNGFEDISDLVEEYPFTNGCLYINKQINIFLRRQDPDGTRGLFRQPNIATPTLLGTINPIEDGTSNSADYSINESEATC